jgi:syndecan 2
VLTLHSSQGIGDEYDDTQIDDTEGEVFGDESPAGQTSGQQPSQKTGPTPQISTNKEQSNKLATTTKKVNVEVEVEDEYDDGQSVPIEEPMDDEDEPIDETVDGSEDTNDDSEDVGADEDDINPDKTNENADEKMIKEMINSSQTPDYKYTNGMNAYSRSHLISILKKPGILAGIIGGIVIGLLTAILLIMFVVYRMRKKDEGSYALAEDTKKPLSSYEYRNVPTKEFYA